jgi:hypothetical protein
LEPVTHTLKLAAVALLAATALTQTALASTAPVPSGLLADIFAADFPASTQVEDQLFSFVGLDTLPVTLEATRLSEVSATFGGTFVHLPDAPATSGWLCYDTATTRTTFFTSGADAGGDPLVNLIVVENIAAPAIDSGCTSTDNAGLQDPLTDNGVPGIGATLDDLASHFGDAKPDATGHIAYVAEAQPGVGAQNIFYLVENGVVTAMAFSQFNETP